MRKVNSRGYVQVHDELGRWVSEHRVVVERTLGRCLRRGEYVHHIDEDRTNNEPDNLVVVNAAQHRRIHNHYERIRREAREEVIATIRGPIEQVLEKHRQP